MIPTPEETPKPTISPPQLQLAANSSNGEEFNPEQLAPLSFLDAQNLPSTEAGTLLNFEKTPEDPVVRVAAL